jgi:hypothetical protein
VTSHAARGSDAPGGHDPALTSLAQSRRLLDPDERLSEILFGLIMVVSITGTLSVATAGRAEVGTMLRAAIGCNLAWGITDAVMYLLSALILRGRGIVALRAVRNTADTAHAHAIIRDALPPAVGGALTRAELEAIRWRLTAGPEPPARPPLTRDDLLAAVGVCVLVFLSTFPVAIPFVLVGDATRALRMSQAIAVAMLFLLGWATARHTGSRPWLLGLAMVLLGVGLVATVVALGG